jgi:hypothetical protein
MDLKDRKIDEFVESKLRKSKVENTSSDFTSFVMKRVQSEYKSMTAEARRDRIAKYIIGVFSSLMVIFTVVIGYLAKSEIGSKVESTGIKIEPTVETSNNILQQFISYVSIFFENLLGFFGLTASFQSISIIVGLILIVLFYFLADRVFLKGKLKSSH